MRDRLIKALEDDMNIRQFVGESKCDYNQRLLYSAGAAWAKTLVYGHSYADRNENEEDDFVNTDILYISSNLSKVLESYLQCFDINLDWIRNDKYTDINIQARALSTQIVEDVISSYNLAKILTRRISPIPNSFYKYDKDLYLIRGNVLNDKSIYTVGVAQWKLGHQEEYLIDRKVIDIKGKDYYQTMDKTFNWKVFNITGDHLIFTLGSKGSFHKCWKPIELGNIPKGISMMKSSDNNNQGYFLVKKIDDNLQIATLDPWYANEYEINRILYALNFENGTPAKFRIKKTEDYSLINCYSRLPSYEERILIASSWPYKTFYDSNSRIVPNFLWGYIEKTIRDLGIILSG